MSRPEESLDVQPTATGWEVVVALPGIEARDLTVEVGETELNIETSTTVSSQAGGFRYRLTLPADVATEAVRTSLVDGTLTITLPRRAPLPPPSPTSPTSPTPPTPPTPPPAPPPPLPRSHEDPPA